MNALLLRSTVERDLGRKMRLLMSREREFHKACIEWHSKMDAVRSLYFRDVGALQKRISDLRAEIEEVCRARRDILMQDHAKSVTTPFGRVGFRRTSEAVCIPNDDEESACELLRLRGLGRFVRVTESLDRTAVKRAVDEDEVGKDILLACGIRVLPSEEAFYCVVNKE